VHFPAAIHDDHERTWNWESWHRCGREFVRVTGEPVRSGSIHAYHEMSVRLRRRIESATNYLERQPIGIEDWVRERFGGPEPKLFVELGSHDGSDTAWMAELPGVTIHALEPDPRNTQPPRPNVTVHRAAVSDRDGVGTLLPSVKGWGREWTYSSSIRPPKNHLLWYPVTFGPGIEVPFVTLDTLHRQLGLGAVDFIWADIQGAEREMLQGGRRTLRRTRYLYTEFSDAELYEGQPTLGEILELLPGFSVLELWPNDVLLRNDRFTG
jgi:FkbM family methyltransferase